MARVFLSHSNKDSETVRRIADDLVAADIDVWLDAWEIVAGDSIVQKIQEGLEDSDLLAVALLNQAVLKESYPGYEEAAKK